MNRTTLSVEIFDSKEKKLIQVSADLRWREYDKVYQNKSGKSGLTTMDNEQVKKLIKVKEN